MSHLRRVLMIAGLVVLNVVLAAGTAAANQGYQRCVKAEGSTGVCQEFCYPHCHLCSCGGICQDNCGPE